MGVVETVSRATCCSMWSMSPAPETLKSGLSWRLWNSSILWKSVLTVTKFQRRTPKTSWRCLKIVFRSPEVNMTAAVWDRSHSSSAEKSILWSLVSLLPLITYTTLTNVGRLQTFFLRSYQIASTNGLSAATVFAWTCEYNRQDVLETYLNW